MQHYGYAAQSLDKEPTAWQFVSALLGNLPTMVDNMLRLLKSTHKIEQHLSGKKRLDPQTAQHDNLMLNPAAWKFYPEIDIPDVPRPPLPVLSETRRSSLRELSG